MEITATIQARMGSSRLPGKVLSNIFGKPMLIRQVERLKRSKFINRIIIATTENSIDEKIKEVCEHYEIEYFRGSEKDVLERLSSLIIKKNIDIHVECFGDSPLIDPIIIDRMINIFLKKDGKGVFVSNSIKTTYPPGMEVNIYKGSTLIDVNKRINISDPLREHVGFNITRFPEFYKVTNIEAPKSLNRPNIYLEVDTKEDLKLIKIIFSHFLSKNIEFFSLKDIILFLNDYPELISINNNIERRWKKYRLD
jgi:spore coat polysaccharide biosynthesis protein SpsF